MKAFVIDVSKCNGCYCCQIVCKDEHVANDWTPYAKPQPDTGQFWLKMNKFVRGTLPKVKMRYLPVLCMHCDDAPCIHACPIEGGIYKRDDGLVIIDPTRCTGCRNCVDSCPYGKIYFNEDLNIAQKCTGCAHLLDGGQPINEPRCVDACPTEALRFQEESELKDLINQAEVLNPEFDTKPRVYYLNMPRKFVAGTVYDPVRGMQLQLGIPVEGFSTIQERHEWKKRHYQANYGSRYKDMPRYYWHFPQEFVERLDSFSYPTRPSRVNYYPGVPLDGWAIKLIRKFDLPQELVDQVKDYIFGVEQSLTVSSALGLILIPVDEGEEGTKYIALVAGIDEASTKKDWLEVWRSIEVILHLSGVTKTPSKRPIDNLLLRDLSFWEQVKGGKTAKEILDDWIERHPEDSHLGEDTVRKAVQRIDKITGSGVSV